MKKAKFSELPDYAITAETICHHEAGHLIVKRFLSKSCAKYTIAVDKESLNGVVTLTEKIDASKMNDAPEIIGQIQKNGDPFDDIPKDVLVYMFRNEIGRSRAIKLAAELYAGLQAEFIYHGVKVGGQVYKPDGDHKKAGRLLRAAGLSKSTFYCQKIANDCLNKYWNEVRALASRLSIQGVVNA